LFRNDKLCSLIAQAFIHGVEFKVDREKIGIAKCEYGFASLPLRIESLQNQWIFCIPLSPDVHLAATARPGYSGTTGADMHITGKSMARAILPATKMVANKTGFPTNFMVGWIVGTQCLDLTKGDENILRYL
jgi:hypothetical protein